MKRTVQPCWFAAMFATLFVVFPTYAATQQTQQGEEAQKEEAQKFAVRQGQGEFAPNIVMSDKWGNPCFRSGSRFDFLDVGDRTSNLRLPASLGWLLSRKAEMEVEIRGNLQFYICTREESYLGLEKLDPTRFKYQDMATILSRSRVEFTPGIEVRSNGIKETLWITVGKDRVIWFKSGGNNYTGIRPTEFVPVWKSFDEMPKPYQEHSDGTKISWPSGTTPPPIWKSVRYDWVRWTPARNQEDALVLRTLSGNGFNIAGVIFSWDSPVLNPAPSAGSVELKPKPLTLSYKAKYTSMAFCLLKQSDISSVDPSLLEFRQAPLDRNYAGSISVETGDVLVFLLDDKNYLAIRPVRVEKSGQFTAVFYERKRGPITPSVASTKKGDLARSAQ